MATVAVDNKGRWGDLIESKCSFLPDSSDLQIFCYFMVSLFYGELQKGNESLFKLVHLHTSCFQCRPDVTANLFKDLNPMGLFLSLHITQQSYLLKPE